MARDVSVYQTVQVGNSIQADNIKCGGCNYFPFANSSFDIYPGNLINKFESVNYRDKVEEKLKKNEIEEGASYSQKCVDI